MISKKNKKILSALAIMAALPLNLMAVESNNFYAGINGMIGYVPEEDFKLTTYDITYSGNSYSLNGSSITNDSKYNFGGSLAAGYMMDNCMQFEAEVGAAMSSTLEAKKTSITPVNATASITGNDMAKTSLYYGMVSGYFNVDMGSTVMPYLGAGAGIGHFKFDLSENDFNTNFTVNDTGAANPTALKNVLNKEVDKNSLVFHASAGANMMLGDSVMLGAGYRFLSSAGDIDLDGDNDDNSNSKTQKVKHHYMRHNAILSAKFLM